MAQRLQDLESIGVRPDFYDLVVPTVLERNVMVLPNGQMLDTKNENEQATGSFKVRGQFNSLDANFVLATAGNAGAGVAWVAHEMGYDGHIFVPEGTAEPRMQLMRDLGGKAITVVKVEGNLTVAQLAAKTQAKRDGTKVQQAFNDHAVIAGHRTVSEEILVASDAERRKTIFAAMGGGSLVASALLATAKTGDRVVGVQFSTNQSASLSLESGVRKAAPVLDARAEGSAANIGKKTFDILQKHRDRLDIITVSPEAVGAAIQREIWRRNELDGAYANTSTDAFEFFPETTGFLAETGAWQYAKNHAVSDDEQWVAIRSGSNSDTAREQALLDAYRAATPIAQSSQQVWHGGQLRP